jgi:hypothetical protein
VLAPIIATAFGLKNPSSIKTPWKEHKRRLRQISELKTLR